MSAPIRVLHVVEAMHRGGAESLLVEQARLAGPDVHLLICALNRAGPTADAATDAGARLMVLGDARGHGPLRPLRTIRLLARVARAERVDVIHGHNPIGGLYGALAARLAGVPAAVRTEHSLHYRGRYSRFYPLIEPLATALTARVVCVCEAVRQSHAPRMRWAAKRFVTVTIGTSPAPPSRPRDTVRAELGVAPGETLVATIGSLTAAKAQETLVDAFVLLSRERPGAQMRLAGEGPLRERLEARIREAGIEGRFRLLGAYGSAADLLDAADVFVLSSVREGLSVTLLEAMRAGLPAVATRVGGNGEAIAEGVTGLLVPPRDPPALAAALAELILDPARARAMGAAARARWEEQFTAERMVRRIEDLYREVIAEARGGARRDARGSA